MDVTLGSPSKKSLSDSQFRATRDEGVDEEARLRRGTVDEDLKAKMITNARNGRASVSQGYATQRSGLGRSTSEASIFSKPPNDQSAVSSGSFGRFKSGMDVLREASEAVSPIRAGWRPNELAPMLETDNEFEAERTASRTGEQLFRAALSAQPTNTTVAGDAGDGFDIDEVMDVGGGLQPFGSPGKRTREEEATFPGQSAANDDEDEDMVATDVEDDDMEGPPSPSPATRALPGTERPVRAFPARSLQATRSLPASGIFGGAKGRKDDFSMDHDF